MGQVSDRYRNSIAAYRDACTVLPGGVNSNFRLGANPCPLFFTSGEGSHLKDVDGNNYIDYALGMGPDILGHAPAALIGAISAALRDGQLFAGQHAREVELARHICRIVPSAQRVRLGLSGSEMVQAALRLARAATGRRKVVKFEGHYHGWYDSIYVSVAPDFDANDPEADPEVQLASAGQVGSVRDDVVVLEWNDLEVIERYLTGHAHETAAIIMEPICCNTCVIRPRSGYLQGVRELCTKHNVVLIFDEVITGFRVGLGGAQALLGVTPDLTVLAKALGGGFPIAALTGQAAIMDLASDRGVVLGGTYNANVASVAAALATLAALGNDDGAVYQQMTVLGERLIDGLTEIGREASVPLRVQGLGTVFNTWFGETEAVTSYREYVTTDRPMQQEFLRLLQDGGIRPTSRGTWFISAAHTVDDIDATLDAAREVMRVVSTK